MSVLFRFVPIALLLLSATTVEAGPGKKSRAKAEQALVKAQEAYEEGDVGACVERSKESLAISPKDTRALIFQGWCSWLAAVEEAKASDSFSKTEEDALRERLVLTLKDAKPAMDRARTEAERNSVDVALVGLQESANGVPRNFQGMMLRGAQARALKECGIELELEPFSFTADLLEGPEPKEKSGD